MKTNLTVFLAFTLMSTIAFSNENKQQIENDKIDIHGYEKISSEDEELDYLKNELNNVKNLKTGFKKKTVVLDDLNQEAKNLNQEHMEYAKRKIEYNNTIDSYKKQQACLSQTNDPSKCVVKKQSDIFMEEFNRIMVERSPRFKECYNQAINKNEATSGSIQFRFRFLPNGKIDHIGIVENMKIQDRSLVRCIYTDIRKINFPETGSDKKINIRKAFNFNIISGQENI